MDPKPELLQIEGFNLEVKVANGDKQPYLGYIEARISVPCLSTEQYDVPLLVVPATNYNTNIPIIVGTNLIRLCHERQLFEEDQDIPQQWNIAFQGISHDKVGVVRSTQRFVLQPFESRTITGLARKQTSTKAVLTETCTDNSCSTRITVCPRVVTLDKPGNTARIPVKLFNMSAKTVAIPAKSNLCDLKEVNVLRSVPIEEKIDTSNTAKAYINRQGVDATEKEKKIRDLDDTDLTQIQKDAVYTLFKKWDHIFSKGPTDLGFTNLIEHEINLTDNKPIKEPPRHIPPAMLDEVKETIQDMIDCDAIRPSSSPYSSNIVLVRKKDGTLRVCLDYRRLNKITVKDAYAIPKIENTLHLLCGSKYFTTLDLKSGYWQVAMKESDKHKTAFNAGPLGLYESNRMPMGLVNSPATFQRLMERSASFELAGIITGVLTLGLCSFIIVFVCLKYPMIRTRTFWDRGLKRLLRRLYSGLRKKERAEDKRSLVLGPMQNRKQEQTKFVVPQIFVDYGSRRQSYASDYLRRCSAESLSSRRTSIASNETDRRGSGSSLSSRRTSLASNDRRGSGSSICSRRTSLLSDCTSRRSSGSSRSSRKGSNASSGRYDDTDELLADFSDSEPHEMDEMYTVEEELPIEVRRSSFEEHPGMKCHDKTRKKPRPYRRSHSLAEIRRPSAIFIPEAKQAQLPTGKCRPDGRRVTLSSLVVSSLNALDHTVNPVAPPYQRKKPKLRPPGIGLPDTPVMMHDLNLEEMMVPRFTDPLQPTGKLKVQLQWSDNALNVIIIEAGDLRIAGLPSNTEVNPYVKAFLVPGRTFKYRTKTINKSRTPVFLEKFAIQDITKDDMTENSALEFQVYSSHHMTRRHLVGMASVQLRDIEKFDNGLIELIILPHSVYRLHQGDIHISGCYQPVAGKIVFSVVEARNLPRVSLLGAVNPYVKVEMYVNGIREAKHKTKVRQNTQDPVWNHACVFDINRENPKLLGHVFVFHIIHKDMMMGVQKIGQVELGWYSHGEQLDHWYDIMEHPHRPTDYWHPIIKTSKITS